MQSLTTLIREARAGDPLARALEAILDSGLIVFTRDNEGHFVQLSQVLTDRAGIVAEAGGSQPRNMRVFDERGRLLAGSEYPAAITRMTGDAQREVLRRLVSDDGRHIWMKMSTMPLERGAEGWSVLSVACDVTDFQDALEDARREIDARGRLLALSLELDGRALTNEQRLEAFGDLLTAMMPGANLFAAVREGDEFVTAPLVNGYGHPLPVQRGRHTAEQRERWSAPRAHVNLDVQDTDIYGASVVAELTNPVRSVVIAPFGGNGTGTLVAFAEQPHAFNEDQIASFEFAARLFGSTFAENEPLARAS